MTKSKMTGLGRGLDSIFIENTTSNDGVTMMRLSQIEPRADQPRKNFDEEALGALAESIARHGLIQPVAVREASGGFYEIIAGERRWRASKLAGLNEIPVVVLAADDKKTAELSLVENIQREDLDPIEEAKAYREIAEKYSYTQEEIAAVVGKSRSAIANSLRLLDLPEEATQLLLEGKLSAGHAKALLGLDDRSRIGELAAFVAERGLSVRECEALVKKQNRLSKEANKEENNEEEKEAHDVDYTSVLENKASKTLGRRVKIVRTGKNKRIELSFEDDSDMESVIEALCGKGIFEDI